MNEPAKVTMTEEGAASLLALALKFDGITTYPKADDDNNRVLHGGCLELERQGKLCRHTDGEDAILWVAPGKTDEPVYTVSIP